jgi:serine phosphatase RsbU (regulator of sigma subunit)/DNA-binding response OmpR family regulator
LELEGNAMSRQHRKLVLIADDTPTNVAVIAGLLKDSFRTKIATNGERALAIATGKEKPDLILLDVMMPDMDGFEVCRRLKANPDTREIPIIFLTAKTDAVDEVRGFDVGAADYIHKPFDPPIVLARVKTQLALKASLARAHSAPSEQNFTASEAFADVLASLAPISLNAGDMLIQQGDESDVAFFLESGSMLVFEETRYGPVTLATVNAPRLIGEIGALAGLARTASVKALTAARVFQISRAQLLELARNSPELLMAVVRQLGQQTKSVIKAVALYTNALAALEKHEFDSAILDDLVNPSPELTEFSAAFRRFADEILRKQRQREEMASAALIQKSFLPKESIASAGTNGVEVRAKIRPAREIGGDFYDFFELDEDRLAIIIGDVCGKGIPASIFMAVVVTTLRTAAREQPDAASTIARANALLCRDNTASLFATTFFGVLNLRSGALDYCNCGHNAPVHIAASGAINRLAATGLPLAMFADHPASSSSARIDPGDILILFTDGVTEALNPLKQEFGDAIFEETLLANRKSELSDLVARVFEAVDNFADGEEQADDIACVAIRRAREQAGNG